MTKEQRWLLNRGYGDLVIGYFNDEYYYVSDALRDYLKIDIEEKQGQNKNE